MFGKIWYDLRTRLNQCYFLFADAEINPVSPSSVPLPDAPPPSSATSKQTDSKLISMPDPTPEQKKLQEQAQHYHQQSQQQVLKGSIVVIQSLK